MKRSRRQWARRIADIILASPEFPLDLVAQRRADALARHRGWPTPVCCDTRGLVTAGDYADRVVLATARELGWEIAPW